VSLDVLQDRSTREHVDRLKATADSEHGHVPRFGRPPRPFLELVALGLDLARAVDRLAVTARIQIGTAAEEQPVHRSQRVVPSRNRRPCVEPDRDRPVTNERRHVQVIATDREVGFGLVVRHGQRHDDPRRSSRRIMSAHRFSLRDAVLSFARG